MSSPRLRRSNSVLIDWFTIGAQALNFLILVWLLKRFLYKPILNAIEAREKLVAAELADADQKKTEARKESDEFKQKNTDFDQKRSALLAQAAAEAKTEGQKLMEQARQATADWRAKQQEALKTEEHNLSQAISLRTQQEVFAIARKTLADLATTSLEVQLADIFIRRLKAMEPQAKAGLAASLKSAREPAVIRGAFDLPPEQKALIQKALNETFSADIHIRYETAPNLVGGIELITNGQKVGWSIAEYLVSLEKGVDEILKEKEKTESKMPSDLTTKIAKRAYELYEQGDHKSDSSVRDWSKAEQEIRKDEVKNKPETEMKAEPKPESKTEPQPEIKKS
jgi:F-type H+-transporting ATPase subunit b